MLRFRRGLPLGILEPAGGGLLYINCGHDAPVVLAGGLARTRLDPTGPALGLLPGLPFGVAQAELAPGECVVLFTDGVTEAVGAEGFFGEDRLLAALGRPAPTAGALLDAIAAAVHGHAAGFEASDDITLMALLAQHHPGYGDQEEGRHVDEAEQGSKPPVGGPRQES